MPFEKGNKFGKGGARVGAGRKKAPATVVKEAQERLDADIPAIFQKLTETALAGDVKAAIYLIDRRLGKPRQDIDAGIGPNEEAVEYLRRLCELREAAQP